MKPAPQMNNQCSRRDSCVAKGRSSGFPKIDYSFQAPRADFHGRCSGDGEPSFRSISHDYFSREARSQFTAEAAVFALIVLCAAVPVIEGVRGLAQFVYGIV